MKLPIPLRATTPDGWAEAALRDPAALLSDHAHNERKAALGALQLAQKLRDQPHALLILARLAEEELNHHRRVIEALQRFGWALGPDGGNRYAQGLHAHGKDLLDRLLIAALIEARSSERLWLLEQACTRHPELGAAPWMDFLLELERCEAGHAVAYLAIARERFPDVDARLDRWLDVEAELIQGLSWESRVH